MVNEERLVQLMENFSGQRFQWIKTNRPELLGKIVRCRIIESRGSRFFAVFEDGSSVDTEQLNSSLIMLTEDMQPLSKAEVEAIAGSVKPQSRARVQPINSQITDSVTQSNPNQRQASPQVASMFEMFDSVDREINLAVMVKMPDQNFLSMLYANAKDKDKFMNELTDYVFNVINKKVVKDSITKMFEDPSKTKQQSGINFIEVDE